MEGKKGDQRSSPDIDALIASFNDEEVDDEDLQYLSLSMLSCI